MTTTTPTPADATPTPADATPTPTNAPATNHQGWITTCMVVAGVLLLTIGSFAGLTGAAEGDDDLIAIAMGFLQCGLVTLLFGMHAAAVRPRAGSN